MAAHIAGRGVQPALPARGDAADAAQGDEQQRLQAAIAAQVDGGILRPALDQQVGALIGIHHLGGDKIIKPAGNADGVGLAAAQLCGQAAQVGRKADVRGLLGQILGLHGARVRVDRPAGGFVQRVHIARALRPGILGHDGRVLVRAKLHIRGALGRIRRVGIQDGQRGVQLLGGGLLHALRRDGQVDAIAGIGGEDVVRDAGHGAQAEAIGAPARHHLADHGLKPGLLLIIGRKGAGIERALGFQQRRAGILMVQALAVQVNKIQLAVQQVFLPLLGGKIRHAAAHFGHRVGLGQGIGAGQALQKKALCFQPCAQHGGKLPGQAAVDEPQGQLILARALQVRDILRQGARKRLQKRIRHRKHLQCVIAFMLPQFAAKGKQKMGKTKKNGRRANLRPEQALTFARCTRAPQIPLRPARRWWTGSAGSPDRTRSRQT